MSETKISSFVGNSRKVIRQRIKRRKEWLARTDFGANSKKKRGALGLATPPNHEDQSFHVTVVSATNLLFKPGEKEITPNVYCVVWISPFKGYLKLTNVKKGSNPRWEESMHFNISDPEPNVLFIEVYHDGGLRRKSLLGSTGVPLSNLKLREKKTRNITVPLYPKNTGHIHLLLRPEDFSNDVEEDSVPIWMDLSGIISKKSGRGLKSILRNSISKEDDQRLDEEYNVKMLDEVYDQLQTGDIMLNSATGTFSQSIQLGTQSDWSHVGMIVVDPPQSIRDKYILPENESVFIFESDSETYDERKGAGVQLIPFRFWLMDYTNDDPNQFTVIRQLLLPDRLKKQSPWETFPNLEAKMLNLHGTSYEKRALDMVRSIRRRNVNNDYSTVFCSELVASCYCSMGLFAQNIVASNFTPKVFSSQEKKAPVTSFLLQGATLGEEFRVRVDLPQGWSPDEYLALHFNSVLKTGSEITTKQCILNSLSLHLDNNALFMSERLYAHSKSLKALYIMAETYLRTHRSRLVCYLLEPHIDSLINNTSNFLRSSSADNDPVYSQKLRYLYSVACIRTQQFKRAERALYSLVSINITETPGECAPQNDNSLNGPSLYWLGILCKRTNRKNLAAQYFERAIKSDPFLWVAYQELCLLGQGENVDPLDIFNSNSNKASHLVDLNMDRYNSTNASHDNNSITVSSNPTLHEEHYSSSSINESTPNESFHHHSDHHTNTRRDSLSSVFEQQKQEAQNQPHLNVGSLSTSSPSMDDSLHSTPSTRQSISNTNSQYLQPPEPQRKGAKGKLGAGGGRGSNIPRPSMNNSGLNSNNTFRKLSFNTLGSSSSSRRDSRNLSTGSSSGAFFSPIPLSLEMEDDELHFPGSSSSHINSEEHHNRHSNPANPSDLDMSSDQFTTPSQQVTTQPTRNRVPNDSESQQIELNRKLSFSSALDHSAQSEHQLFEASTPTTPTTPPVEGSLDIGNQRAPSHEFGPNTVQPPPVRSQRPKAKPRYKSGGTRMFNESNHADETNDNNNNNSNNINNINNNNKIKPTVRRVSFNESMGNISNDNSTTHLNRERNGNYFIQNGNMQSELSNLFQLFTILGEAFRLFCLFRSRECIEMFQRLPENQYKTHWVLQHIGRAQFEIQDFINAQDTFAQLVESMDITQRLEGLEIYSTILWHLRKEKELSFLAQKMKSIDPLSPYTLCAIGNCFSLQKDHQTALKFFERALQMDPFFTYAYTLAGHEHFANDNHESALQYYQKAIRIDARHYNAWYGIGVVYYRQEKYGQADYHFKRALSINSRSSVLYCYLGMTLFARKQYTRSLQMLENAINLHSQNPIARYKKASVLIRLRKYRPALSELEQLKDIAPKEASVYFTMGKVYKLLGYKDKALIHYNLALDLDDNPFIKAAIDKLDADKTEDDEESDPLVSV